MHSSRARDKALQVVAVAAKTPVHMKRHQASRETDAQQQKLKRSGAQPPPQQQEPDEADKQLRAFYKAWAWKREHLPDRLRFVKPYTHQLQLPDGSFKQLALRQAKFKALGFASTVWDSAIVLAKLLEHRPQLVAGAQLEHRPQLVAGAQRVLDLSAGCGLLGVLHARSAS